MIARDQRTDPAPGTDVAVKDAILTARDLGMLATAANYDVNDSGDRGRSVADLSRLFFRIAAALKADLFIEAGAKDAATSREARRLLDPRRIVAFEANPFTYERHQAKHDNAGQGVEYLHRALSNSPGEVTFNVLRNQEGTPRADGRSSLLLRTGEAAGGSTEVTVQATTLDTFFADHTYERSAIWVDVEGALEPVLGGGIETFERAAIVIAEVEDRAYWSGQWLRSDVVSFLYDRDLLPIARDYQSRYQYNIVFVRRELVDDDRVRWLVTHHRSASARPRAAALAPPPSADVAPQSSAGLGTVRAASTAELVKVLRRRAVRSVRRRLTRRRA